MGVIKAQSTLRQRISTLEAVAQKDLNSSAYHYHYFHLSLFSSSSTF